MNNDNVVTCPKCGGKTWKYGKIPSRQGMTQKYKCLSCAYTFTKDRKTEE